MHGAGVVHEVNALRPLPHHKVLTDFKLHLHAVLAVPRREEAAGHNCQIPVVLEETQIRLSRNCELESSIGQLVKARL